MATPKAIISRALRLYGALGIGETMSADVQSAGLEALNAMLDSSSTDRLALYATSRTTKVLTASDGEYSIGSGGDINVTQPVSVENANLILAGGTREDELRVMGADEWASEPYKSSTGTPYGIHFARGITSSRGTVYVVYVPDAAHTLVLYLKSQFAQIAASAIDTDYVLPQGALEAIVFNLALRMAAEDGKTVSDDVRATAIDSLAAYKISNHQPIAMTVDELLLIEGNVLPDITSGDF